MRHTWRLLGPALVVAVFSLSSLLSSAALEPAPEVAPYCASPLIVNWGFESGSFAGWSTSGAPVVITTGGYSGWHSAGLGGRNNAVDRISQVVESPYSATEITAGAYVYMHPLGAQSSGLDTFRITLADSTGPIGAGEWGYGSWAKDTWVPLWVRVGLSEAWAPGSTWELSFEATTDGAEAVWFLVDDAYVRVCCQQDSFETNDSFATARDVTPGSYNLRVCPSWDEDWFRFDAVAGQLISLSLGVPEVGQARLCLVSPSGQEVGWATPSYPDTANLSFVANASGPWRARVHDPGGLSGGSLLQLGIQVGPGPTATRTASPTLSRTPTTTPSPTRTRTPTLTHTPTPDATQEPGPLRVSLPLVMADSEGPAVTPTKTATRTRTPTPTATIPGVIFVENFDDSDLTGWTFTGGTWTNPGAWMRGVSTPYRDYALRPESAADFSYEGTVTLEQGTAAGLIFRASGDGSECYGAVLDAGENRFKLFINWEGWFGPVHAMTVEYNRPYRIRIEGRGNQFDAWVDGGGHIWQTLDYYPSGQFGVIVSGGAARFDDLAATTLP